MKSLKLFLASVALALCATAASVENVKIGVLIGFTGPMASTTMPMAKGAEMAMKEVSDSGKLLGGDTVTSVHGDTTCSDSSAAKAAAETLITVDGVKGIMGAECSGATTAVLKNVAMPNGIVMISPASTSPALSTMPDDGLFFRTPPSDARQGIVMTNIILEHGIKSVALTYTNNDYGKGLADSFERAYKDKGGKVTISIPHQDGKGDYSAEVASLASAGGQALVVAGYVDQGGSGIIRAALDTGAFSTFVLPDSMVASALEKNFGSELDGSFGQQPSSNGKGYDKYLSLAKAAGFDGTALWSAQSYDAAALIMLAMQMAGSSDPTIWKKDVMKVANGNGEKIYPGDLSKALELIRDGKAINYEGATNVHLIGNGDAAGTYREIAIRNGKITTVRYR